jgi:hypothetical protein
MSKPLVYVQMPLHARGFRLLEERRLQMEKFTKLSDRRPPPKLGHGSFSPLGTIHHFHGGWDISECILQKKQRPEVLL